MSKKSLLVSIVVFLLAAVVLAYVIRTMSHRNAGRLSQMKTPEPFESYVLNYDTPVDAELQGRLETIDAKLRQQFEMTPEHAAAGILDLRRLRLAMIHPDREDYAASVAKIGILLAYFQLRPDAIRELDPQVRHELGLMAKASSNEMAAKYSRELGLHQIQEVLDSYGFYDANRGGGLWVGRHYGQDIERYGDPVGDHSHAVTVRQVLRYFLLLEQGKLVSPKASHLMREIFESPVIPHDQIKFVQALDGRPDVRIIRKWGTWQDWLHDSAVITGPSRHYILVGLTHHPKGDEYLVGLARAMDDYLAQ
jgi:beta-lactamase class A